MNHLVGVWDALHSPKLDKSRSDRWYRYYAGFAPEFVRDVIDEIKPDLDDGVLDPWVGSGTTLSVAASLGYRASGLDLNPAMVVVAKGRLIADDTRSSVQTLRDEILRQWRPVTGSAVSDDPLSHWFDFGGCGLIRGLAQRIDEVLVLDHLTPDGRVQSMSSLAAFFYVALFDSVTSLLKDYRSSNPTWVKGQKIGSGDVVIERPTLESNFKAAVDRLAMYVKKAGALSASTRDLIDIRAGNSRRLPFEASSFGTLISSPPYLTRLDYVVGHRVELAVLGFGDSDIRSLRQQMIGTPTIGGVISKQPLGNAANEFLAAVSSHDSYAAAEYYAPNFRQYFEGMADSLAEANRVTRPGGNIVLVVQDSRFKGIHADLAQCIADMSTQFGWVLTNRSDFTSIRSMAQVNSRAHKDARTLRPIESVLHFVSAAPSNIPATE